MKETVIIDYQKPWVYPFYPQTQVRCNSLYENSELEPQLRILECCTNSMRIIHLQKECYTMWQAINIRKLHIVYVCVFDREKICQPVEIDNRRALMSCCFCSFHHFGGLFLLMLIISLDLCPIGSRLLWCMASSLRISCCVTKSSLW